jgi:iron complex transport system substrate-binding protein
VIAVGGTAVQQHLTRKSGRPGTGSEISAKLVSSFQSHVKATSRLCVYLGGLAIVAAACQVAPTSSPPANQSAQFPVTIQESTGATVTIDKQPHRIISLSPTATEMLYAIGAGTQVVAVDDQSNYPAGVPTTKLSGFQPNIEAIAAYSPDLVVAAEDTAGLVHGLEALKIPILIEVAAKNLDDSYLQIKQLGDATGHVAESGALQKTMRSAIGAVIASVPKPVKPLTVYHELDDTYYSATSDTFIGQVYALLGLKNIADGAAAKAPDYPQLSAEYIVASNPDLIVLADTKCCHQDASTVGGRPGWSSIAAVRSSQVILADDDVASRWGPRVVDFLQLLAPHIRAVELQTQ